jgi:hypothetical protein
VEEVGPSSEAAAVASLDLRFDFFPMVLC